MLEISLTLWVFFFTISVSQRAENIQLDMSIVYNIYILHIWYSLNIAMFPAVPNIFVSLPAQTKYKY